MNNQVKIKKIYERQESNEFFQVLLQPNEQLMHVNWRINKPYI